MTAIRLLLIWTGVALLLLAWAGLTGPAATPIPLDGAGIVLAEPPAAPILTLWVRAAAVPPGRERWVTLEPAAASPGSADEIYLRRRVHPGWNQLIWDDLSRLRVGHPVRLRVLDGEGPVEIAPPRASTWYTLDHLRPLRGLLAAMLLGGAAAVLVGRGLRAAAWKRPRPWHLAILTSAAGALALRLHTLTAQSYWFDEVLTAIGAQSFAWVLYSAQIFGHPPLQYLLGWAAGGVAAGEGALRAPFVAAGVGGVVVMALLGRRLVGPTTGLLAAGLLAVSPFHIELSQLARPYAVLVLVLGLSWLALFRALERSGIADWLGFSAVAALVFYTHYLGGPLVLVHAAVAALWIARRRGANGLAALVSFAGVALLLLPWADVVRPLAGAQLGAGQHSGAALGEFITRVLIPEQLGSGAPGLLTGALLLLGLWGLRGRPEVALAAILSVTLPLALVWAINPAHALAGRHFAVVVPMVMLLIAHGLVVAGRFVETILARHPGIFRARTRRAVAASAAVALIVASHLPAGAALGGYYRGRHGPDWRTVAEVLDRLVGPDEEVVATLGAVYPLRHYWRPAVDEIDAVRLRERFREGPRAGRAWVVTIEGWDGAPELHAWLAAHAIRVGEVPPAWSRQRVYIHAVTRRTGRLRERSQVSPRTSQRRVGYSPPTHPHPSTPRATGRPPMTGPWRVTQ